MAGSLERYKSGRALAVHDEPVSALTSALSLGTKFKGQHHPFYWSFQHGKGMADFAQEQRAKYLPQFASADAGRLALRDARRESLDRATAVEIVGAILAAFGAKADKDLLAAMIDVLEGNEIARASGLWQPVDLSPAVLALARCKLIATKEFPPRPAELHAACLEASKALREADAVCDEMANCVQRCDAVLLEFAHDEWRRPYLMPQYRPLLPRMLELHDICGDGSDDFDDPDQPNTFREALDRVRAEQIALSKEESCLDR
jgi:hypothetical protein